MLGHYIVTLQYLYFTLQISHLASQVSSIYSSSLSFGLKQKTSNRGDGTGGEHDNVTGSDFGDDTDGDYSDGTGGNHGDGIYSDYGDGPSGNHCEGPESDLSTYYSASARVSDLNGGGGTSKSSSYTLNSCQTPLVSDAWTDQSSGDESDKSSSDKPDDLSVCLGSDSNSEVACAGTSRQGQYDDVSSMGFFMTQGKEFPGSGKQKAKSKSEPGILQASRNGNVPAVKKLIAQCCDLTVTDSNKCTALHFASSFGHAEIVKLLVQSGADLDARSAAGKTPLHEACINGRFNVLRVLESEVTDLDVGDYNGLSAAHWCALNGEVKCLSLLCNQVK